MLILRFSNPLWLPLNSVLQIEYQLFYLFPDTVLISNGIAAMLPLIVISELGCS
ncbi:MAG: hypothetical protein ABFS56_21265 [Pseudomonadota bacterium]